MTNFVLLDDVNHQQIKLDFKYVQEVMKCHGFKNKNANAATSNQVANAYLARGYNCINKGLDQG